MQRIVFRALQAPTVFRKASPFTVKVIVVVSLLTTTLAGSIPPVTKQNPAMAYCSSAASH